MHPTASERSPQPDTGVYGRDALGRALCLVWGHGGVGRCEPGALSTVCEEILLTSRQDDAMMSSTGKITALGEQYINANSTGDLPTVVAGSMSMQNIVPYATSLLVVATMCLVLL